MDSDIRPTPCPPATMTTDDERYRALVADDEQTCSACPVQWEGQLRDGRFFYFRYRSGNATLAIGPTLDEVRGRMDQSRLRIGDGLDGSMTDDEYRCAFLALLWQIDPRAAMPILDGGPDDGRTIRMPLPSPGTLHVLASDGDAYAFVPVAREFLLDGALPAGRVVVEQLDDAISRLHGEATRRSTDHE